MIELVSVEKEAHTELRRVVSGGDSELGGRQSREKCRQSSHSNRAQVLLSEFLQAWVSVVSGFGAHQ